MIQEHPAIQRYLRALNSELQRVPNASRETIIDDVRAHVADAVDAGREPDEVLAALGSPKDVARDAREQFGISADPSRQDNPADRASRMLHRAAVILAVVTAVFVAFILPSYATEEGGVSSDSTGSTLQTATGLFEQYGLGVALLPLVPALLALLPLLSGSLRLPVSWLGAVLVTGFSIVAGLSIGGFFVPLALLMWTAVLVPLWIRRGASPVVGRSWRIVGALLMVAPALLGIGGALTGTFLDPGAPFWIVTILAIGVSVLFALRVRFIDVTVGVLGVAIMGLAVFDAGLLVLAVWWGGGLWLVIGLSAVAARRSTAGR
ncbi:DUF1700 domain-containing protein [Mycetocola manganoxydans]|uniref:DUF1700 domain-containing protein n=1 Tax=Mycetocola manganoxydans TaxID=699879 RepID=A0A3L6ZYI4_9MICO|nr:DUF1700 domain-containing protein [Mycetocola manganoxydans]RLP72884.1 DUF1700 domain-containing protein [Mycetocola manganoxydans]GHD45150.1 hypothetical protein GCM10008097_14080 [Mycetocola manganoxydans]